MSQHTWATFGGKKMPPKSLVTLNATSVCLVCRLIAGLGFHEDDAALV